MGQTKNVKVMSADLVRKSVLVVVIVVVKEVGVEFVAQFILVERNRWKSRVDSFSAWKFLRNAWNCWRGMSRIVATKITRKPSYCRHPHALLAQTWYCLSKTAVPNLLHLISNLDQAQSSRSPPYNRLIFPSFLWSIMSKWILNIRVRGSVVSSSSRVRGGRPAANAFVAFYKATSGLWLTNKHDFISIS